MAKNRGQNDDAESQADRDVDPPRKPQPNKMNTKGAAKAGSYDVGYKKPPKHKQIQKGQVLNPNGREKGSKNKLKPVQAFYDMVLEEARREVPLGDGSEMSMPLAQAIVRSTFVHAVKGSPRAQRIFADLMREAELDEERRRNSEISTAQKYKTDYAAEMLRRKRHGISGPRILPDASHVEIDLAFGCVRIRGPASEHEFVAFERWEIYRTILLEELAELKLDLDNSSKSQRGGLENEISFSESLLTIVGHVLQGNRDALGFLEQGYASLTRVDPEFGRPLFQECA